MPPRARNLLRLVLPLAVSLALLLWLALHVDLASSFRLAAQMPLPLALAAGAATLACYVFSSLRFWLLVRPAYPVRPMQGIGLNLLTILSAHGIGLLSDGLRVHFLMTRGASLRQGIDFTLADRLLTLWLLLFCAALLFPFTAPQSALVYGGSGMMLLLLLASLRIGRQQLFPAWLQPCLDAFTGAVNTGPRLLKQLLASLGCCLAIALAFACLAQALDFALPFGTALAFAPLAVLASSVPFTYAGLGTREAAFAFGLPLLAPVSAEQAIALSLSFAVFMLLASLPGLLFLPVLTQKPDGPH